MTTERQNAPAEPASTPRWLRALPVLVLLVAIAAQATLMATNNADRQSGSGFAMFSSVEFAGSRSVVITATYQGDPVLVKPPDSFDATIDKLLRAPTDAAASALAAELGPLMWNRNDAAVVSGTDSPVREITVTIRGLATDGRQLRAEVLAQGVSP